MSIRKVGRADWFSFFDHTGTLLAGKQVEVEVASPRLGSQIVTRALPLLGMVYDPRSDVLEILLDGLDHLVQHPREIYVDDPPFAAMSIGVTDGEGVLQIITLRDPPMLPAWTLRG
jgi:hypothetical protein